MSEPYVLLVGEHVPPTLELGLRAATKVKRCPGAGSRYCPMAHHERCELRDEARMAVVWLAGEHELSATTQWQCVSSAASPGVAVLEGSDHPLRARRGSGSAIVGSAAGPAAILAAMAILADEPRT